MIFENLIQTNLRTKYLGKFIEYYKIIDSTNKEAKSLVENHKAKHGMMVITDSQKHGKGRSNNHWFMSPGKGLAMSIIYLNQLSLNKALLIPLATGLAIAKSLENRGLKPQLKWPNDIIIKGKKIGGVLCENKIKNNIIESCVIGIGLNINETINDFPNELQNIATSLFIEAEHSFQRELICAIITTFLEKTLENYDSVIKEWLLYCNHLNKEVTFNYKNKKYLGIFKNINKNGFAQIFLNGKLKEFPSININ